MASLYEIDAQITSCVDEETGEVIDLERLEALMLDRSAKLEGVACWIKDLDSDIAAIEAECKKQKDRIESLSKKRDGLMEYLKIALDGEKFSTPKCVCSWRKSTYCEIDEAHLPKKYWKKKITLSPDKSGITDLLKTGASVKGAELRERMNLSVS